MVTLEFYKFLEDIVQCSLWFLEMIEIKSSSVLKVYPRV